ncbi:uncharacterized protein [Dermacentor andersoni]|uniref:uncharacterized protein isoform X3 n=1 Tax=Dermacentor andersoni TaxID=34620 RepID=UPI002415F697|nr:uncharacterized protein LOC126533193 isoform X3 [Dermacentor andersoni]
MLTPSSWPLLLLLVSLLTEYARAAFSHQTYNKEPERRLGETCITRTACELGDAHSDCIHWQCQCKKGFRIEFLHGVPVCVTGFFPNQCYSHNQCIEMDEHALCVSNVCDCENGYQRELIYWKYVCRPEKSDKSLIIFILSFTLLLLIVVLLYIGKHYVQSECAGPPNPPCPASTTITGFTGSIQDADRPAAQLRGGDAVPLPAVVEKMTFTPRGMEAFLSLTSGLSPCDARAAAAVHSPHPTATGGRL